MTRPVNVVVVAFGVPEQLEQCLNSLGTELPTVVVDNSSSAAVAAVVSRRGGLYDDPGVNSGFAAGVNRALRLLLAGPAVDVLLLNPDAALGPSEVDALSTFLHRPGNERLAAVVPRLLGADNRERRVVWPFPTPLRCWAEAVGLRRLPARATFVIGAAVLLRWEALKEVGLFDERFFLYAEETDWQRRALGFGWRSALCPDAVGLHVGAGTATDVRRREALFHAGQETYIRKWYGTRGWWGYRSAACFGAVGRAILLTGKRRAEAARRALLYARGPRRCAGITS
jgi:GT2 family glycosyltransferase